MKEVLPYLQIALAFGVVPLIAILWKLSVIVAKLPTEMALVIANLKTTLYEDFVTKEQMTAMMQDDRKVVPIRRARARNGN